MAAHSQDFLLAGDELGEDAQILSRAHNLDAMKLRPAGVLQINL